MQKLQFPDVRQLARVTQPMRSTRPLFRVLPSEKGDEKQVLSRTFSMHEYAYFFKRKHQKFVVESEGGSWC